MPLSPALRARQALALRRQLSPHIDGHLEVHITDNRTVMMSVKRDPKHRRYSLRLHHLFLRAPSELMGAIADYVTLNEQTASKEISRYIEQNDHRMDDSTAPRRTVVRTAGRCHDLALLSDELDRRYFGGRIDATITWGRNATPGRARGSIRLGSYCVEEKLIRIHPGLDQVWVPSHYLAWVVYHEMLHVVHPIPLVNGRRRFHTPAFAADERRYEHYDWARTWEQRNIAALLSL